MKIARPFLSLLTLATLLTTGPIHAEDATDAPATLSAAERINAFGLELLQAALDRPDSGTILLSPLNLAQVALMLDSGVSEGSSYETSGTIGALFGLEGSDGLTALALQAAELSQDLQNGDAAAPLRLAASIWTAPTLALWPEYQEFLEGTFGASVEQADFTASETLDRINQVISEQTGGLISPMLEDLDAQTRLLLASALHFKADWAMPFDPAQTVEGPFTTAAGDEVSADFMVMESTLEHWSALDSEFAALPFTATPDQPAFEIVIGLPGADVNMASWDDEDWRALLNHAASDRTAMPVTLQLPRLSARAGGDMAPLFEAAGFGQLFSTPFDTLSEQAVVIDSLVHRAVLEWNEAGAEAATATVAGMVRTIAITPHTLRIDRPFLVLLREKESGLILLLGSIDRP